MEPTKEQIERDQIRTFLELLMYRAEVMREAQVDYFRLPTEAKKTRAIGLEQALDKAIKELKRRGYSTDHIRQRAEQKTLF